MRRILGLFLATAFAACHQPQAPTIEEELDMGHYQRVAEMALGAEQKDSVTAFYYFLACAYMDALPDSLLRYAPLNLGTLHKIGEHTPLPIINMMNDLYYALGDMVYAERAAMMACVFAPDNMDWRMIRRLAEVNLVSCDTLAAMKYLRVLATQDSHRGWASDHTPGKMSADVERDIQLRRQRVNLKDTMRLGDNCRTILIELLESNPDNTIALDYLLCTSLWLKGMDTFKADYDRYARRRRKPLYQQALMIWLAGTGAPQKEWEKYIYDTELLRRFAEYNRHRGSVEFSDTYWYYFDKR